jgi:hypothetical protein
LREIPRLRGLVDLFRKILIHPLGLAAESDTYQPMSDEKALGHETGCFCLSFDLFFLMF